MGKSANKKRRSLLTRRYKLHSHPMFILTAFIVFVYAVALLLIRGCRPDLVPPL